MTIYLHCGGHKTASSFMKMFLRKNQAFFESQGIAVHLNQFRDRQITPEDIIEVAKADYQNNYQKIIISEDANIIGLMPGIFAAGSRNFFNTNSILRFSNLVAKINQKYPLKFMLCVRRQDTYLESCYKFRKTHGAKYSWLDFLTKAQKINVSWYDVINSVASYIGQENCLITPYELLKRSDSEFIATFFQSISAIDPKKIVIPPPNNQGASKLMMETIDYLDTDFSDIPHRHRQNIISIIKKHQKKTSIDNSLFSQQDRNNILQKYAIGNQKLFSTYIPYLPENYYDPGEIIPATPSNNVRSYDAQPLAINN